MGDVADFSNFRGAVIDEPAFKSITEYVDFAKEASEAEFVTGGGYDDSKGYFVEPTTVLTDNPKFKLMEEGSSDRSSRSSSIRTTSTKRPSRSATRRLPTV